MLLLLQLVSRALKYGARHRDSEWRLHRQKETVGDTRRQEETQRARRRQKETKGDRRRWTCSSEGL